jgi:hypothetical protein
MRGRAEHSLVDGSSRATDEQLLEGILHRVPLSLTIVTRLPRSTRRWSALTSGPLCPETKARPRDLGRR